MLKKLTHSGKAKRRALERVAAVDRCYDNCFHDDRCYTSALLFSTLATLDVY